MNFSSMGQGDLGKTGKLTKLVTSAPDYSGSLLEDVVEGTTGLVCIDSFSRQLRETGYLHNHQRMWNGS